jgi:hypothetical protein
MTCVFESFESHCHILKELDTFLPMMGAIIIFGENIFIFSFVVTKSVGLGCTCAEVAEKIKCQKMNVNFSQPNYG